MSFFIREPYYIRDLKRDPNLEKYPFPACLIDTEAHTPQGRGASSMSGAQMLRRMLAGLLDIGTRDYA